MKQKIYISGPMTGYEDFNRPAFRRAEDTLRAAMDATFINPARLDEQAKPDWEWPDFMRNSMKAMLDADAIYMLNGWEKSKGALIEFRTATDLGIPVMFQPYSIPDYNELLKGCLILDTETTGLGPDAEIVEISIINHQGDVLINSLIKPLRLIPDEVVKIHGITNAMLEDQPYWYQKAEDIYDVIDCGHRARMPLVIWNKDFDTHMIEQTSAGGDITFDRLLAGYPSHCAQTDYKRLHGERKADGTLKRQSLANACKQLGIEYDTTKAHRALYDCQRTLEVMKAMAAMQEIGA